MKKSLLTSIITLLAISFSLTTFAQTKSSRGIVRKGSKVTRTVVRVQPSDIMNYTGKWQEIKRVDINTKKQVAFTDTLLLDFNKRDSVIVRSGNSMSQKGFAGIDNDKKLQVAGDLYSVVSLTAKSLIINDGEFIRKLQKRKKFYHETLGNIIIPKENISDPVVINKDKLTGHWDVYRTQAVPGAAEDSAIIKQIKFNSLNEDGSLGGVVTFVKAATTETLPFKAIVEKGGFKLETLKHTWIMQTYKADGKEFIFGHQGGLVYFAKQL